MNTYIKIFQTLRDYQWHKKSDFCRPYSEDRRRLNDMKLYGWVDYEERAIRKGQQILYTEYRFKEIFPAWWKYAHRFGILKMEESGQRSFI